jgi:hypothetical protein
VTGFGCGIVAVNIPWLDVLVYIDIGGGRQEAKG